MRKIVLKIASFIFVVAFATTSFAINITTMGLDESLMTTYLAEDESQNNEIIKVIYDFIYKYIEPEMSDFEKEIAIIKYLVETTTYAEEEEYNDSNSINDSYKAYGALINHRATCSGYAKAFDLIAKKCYLSSIVVTGSAKNSSGVEAPHAWHQIYLDDEWYNVDVTWEDPSTNLKVGFNQLFNNYINGTDAEFSVNHFRENGHTCTATKYGKNTVAYYLNTGKVDFNADVDSIRKLYVAQVGELILAGKKEEADVIFEKLMLLGTKYDDNSNYINSNDDAIINTYILSKVAAGEKIIVLVTGAGTQNKLSVDKADWLQNNINIPGKTSLNKIFSSDGTYDTRILVFKFTS